MSNHLAVATVTAVLRQVVLDALQADQEGLQLNVWTLRPGEVPKDKAGVNLHLYQVTPNAHWRNADAPTRRADGTLVQRPQAALDLHYLVTFHGEDAQLVPQRLLGSTVRVLHAKPVLGKERIRQVVKASQNAPPPKDYLSKSDLADQVESVRITPVTLNLEESSKLWSALQSPQLLSLTYQATVVLIEADDRPGAPLPVRRWDSLVLPGRPVLDRVVAEDGREVTARSVLLLQGQGLRGPRTLVRVGDALAEPAKEDVTERTIRLPLLSILPPGSVPAGLHAVTVEHEGTLDGRPHLVAASEPAPLVVRPAVLLKPAPLPGLPQEHDVTATNVQAGGDGKRSSTIVVKVEPPVGPRQRAVLLLNRREAPATAFSFPAQARDAPTAALSFPVRGLPTGTYLVRVRVDGVESQLAVATDGPDKGAYAAPRVVIA